MEPEGDRASVLLHASDRRHAQSYGRYQPALFSESSVIFAAGLATRTWQGATLWGEAGSSINYLSHHVIPDYRGGLSFSRGKTYKSAWFFDTSSDALYMSRFHQDGLFYVQYRIG